MGYGRLEEMERFVARVCYGQGQAKTNQAQTKTRQEKREGCDDRV
jgi:hypothetical protein